MQIYVWRGYTLPNDFTLLTMPLRKNLVLHSHLTLHTTHILHNRTSWESRPAQMSFFQRLIRPVRGSNPVGKIKTINNENKTIHSSNFELGAFQLSDVNYINQPSWLEKQELMLWSILFLGFWFTCLFDLFLLICLLSFSQFVLIILMFLWL